MFQVRKATRKRRPLKVSIEGLSGSGKTFTGLRLLFAMQQAGIGKRVVVADSENSSSELYSGITIDGVKWEYDVVDLDAEHQNPVGYAQAYDYLCKQGYDLIMFDSLSHAWYGALERVEQIAARGGRGDKFSGWSQVTPEQRQMLAVLTDNRANLVATMRVKSEYDLVDKNGKQVRQKVGVKVDQRDNTEYEFDMVLRIDQEHLCHVEKVRGCTVMDGKSVREPGATFFKPLFDWWKSAEVQATPPTAPKQQPTPSPEREPGDDGLITERTHKAIEAALASLGMRWGDGMVMTRVCEIIGRVIQQEDSINDLTETEGADLLQALNRRITEKAKQPKGQQ